MKKTVMLFLCVFLFFSPICALADVPAPTKGFYAADYADILSPETVSLEDFAPFSTRTIFPISSTIPVNTYFSLHSKRMSSSKKDTSGFPKTNALSGTSTPIPPTGDFASVPPNIFGAI